MNAQDVEVALVEAGISRKKIEFGVSEGGPQAACIEGEAFGEVM